jgi:hypothetical protein
MRPLASGSSHHKDNFAHAKALAPLWKTPAAAAPYSAHDTNGLGRNPDDCAKYGGIDKVAAKGGASRGEGDRAAEYAPGDLLSVTSTATSRVQSSSRLERECRSTSRSCGYFVV